MVWLKKAYTIEIAVRRSTERTARENQISPTALLLEHSDFQRRFGLAPVHLEGGVHDGCEVPVDRFLRDLEVEF